MRSFKGDEGHSLCIDCTSTIDKGCVNCNSKVSPSKFKLQSRSCERCVRHSQGSIIVETSIFDTLSSADTSGSEMTCTHEDLLPMVMEYKKNADGYTAPYYYRGNIDECLV